ncbi:MAG TPA: anti-sigma factor [Burkholderiaceae bacterium]|nr:anti-sigma factor [Burkholderiaceae bacterium]
MSLDDEELSAQIRRHATRYSAPDGLRAAVRTQITLAEAGRATRPGRRWFGFGVPSFANFGWRTASVSFAAGLASALFVLPAVQRLQVNESLDTELVADHVRALRIGPLTEVVSTDRHTVKPWFQGRIDYAPPVFDLATDGFPLRGGRIEHVRGNTVATLAYARDLHMIDVFVWPSDARTQPELATKRGFNLLHWADGSMQYWAVSDVEAAELERFAQLWQAQRTK